MCPASAGQSLESRLAAQRSVLRASMVAIMTAKQMAHAAFLLSCAVWASLQIDYRFLHPQRAMTWVLPVLLPWVVLRVTRQKLGIRAEDFPGGGLVAGFVVATIALAVYLEHGSFTLFGLQTDTPEYPVLSELMFVLAGAIGEFIGARLKSIAIRRVRGPVAQ